MIVLFLWSVCCLFQALTGNVAIKDTNSMLIALACELGFEFLILLFRVKVSD